MINKIVVVGAGNVGEAIGYTLMLRRQANEIVFVDVDEKKALGAALDVSHAITYVGKVNVKNGGYEECEDADLVIITAGARRKPGQTRLELAKINISIMTEITRNIMKYAKNDPIILVVSNPVDLMTYVVQDVSGLPVNRVIGTGTALDTARFRYMIADRCNVDVNDVSAFILGEHGDSQVSIWSRVTVAGENIEDYLADNPYLGKIDYYGISDKTRDAGAEIIAAKGATFYGVAMAVSRIVEAIAGNERAIMSVSHAYRKDFGGLKDLAVSMVCMIGKHGIEKTLTYTMSDEEWEAVLDSARKMRDFVKECYANE